MLQFLIRDHIGSDLCTNCPPHSICLRVTGWLRLRPVVGGFKHIANDLCQLCNQAACPADPNPNLHPPMAPSSCRREGGCRFRCARQDATSPSQSGVAATIKVPVLLLAATGAHPPTWARICAEQEAPLRCVYYQCLAAHRQAQHQNGNANALCQSIVYVSRQRKDNPRRRTQGPSK